MIVIYNLKYVPPLGELLLSYNTVVVFQNHFQIYSLKHTLLQGTNDSVPTNLKEPFLIFSYDSTLRLQATYQCPSHLLETID